MTVEYQSNDVVDDLLALEDRASVVLRAEKYDWRSPFRVDVLADVEWDAAEGDNWRSRSLRLEPDDGRAKSRDVKVVEGLAPPSIGSYGRIVGVRQEDMPPEEPDVEWLDRPADEIVEGAGTRRDLEEVLREVRVAEGWFDVHKRLAADSVSATKNLLWELGLREQSGRLLGEPELQERADRLREVFVDE